MDLLYLGFLAAILLGVHFVLRRFPQNPFFYVLLAGIYAVVTVFVSLKIANCGFAALRFMCLAVFIGGPLFLSICCYHARSRFKILTALYAIIAVIVIGIGIDAFVIEPHWLVVNRYQLTSSKIGRPLKIAVLSDIQTDEVGSYEEKVVHQVMSEKPDLILLAGDYIQIYTPKERAEQVAKFKAIFKNLKAPLGVYAVEGNVEQYSSLWYQDLFNDVPIKTFPRSATVELDKDLQLTGLTLKDSFDQHQKIEKSSQFHIVLGHGPDFALGQMGADLLVAGHTHGGQVQLPFFGPILTLSLVPTRWAGGGFFETHPGTHFILTRGVGMERQEAPRLRFLCRPEIVFLDLLPDGKTLRLNK